MARLNKFILMVPILCGAVAVTALFHRNSIRRPDPAHTGMNGVQVPGLPETSTFLPLPNPGASEDAWSARWRRLKSMPKDATRDAQELAMIRELAALDPLRAISFAVGEKDGDLRGKLLQVTMRTWGTKNPEAAIEWATSQDVMDSSEAIAAAFHGAVEYPDNAMQLAETFSERDPVRARDYGAYVIAALSDAGDYKLAADFAAQSDGQVRVDLLNAAFSNWAAKDPSAAMDAASRITDPDTRRDAFAAAVSQWANNDPKAAAEYALTVDSPQDRQFALSAALREWAADNPIDAANWLAKTGPAPELDQAVAAIASNPAALNEPQTALGWADGITDPSLKVRVLATILNAWAGTDPASARSYADTMPITSPEERQVLLSAFDPGFTPVSYLP